MKIVTEPSVFVVGKQTVCDDQMGLFLQAHGWEWSSDGTSAGEVLAEASGRLCYLSYPSPRPGGNAAYLKHIIDVQHGSVLSHAVWTLFITGVSRSLTHELIRHGVGCAYSQLSQRYVDESVAEYVEPDIIANDPELHSEWLSAVQVAHYAYCRLAAKLTEKLKSRQCDRCHGEGDVRFTCSGKDCVNGTVYSAFIPTNADATTRRKFARQAARSVLPNATETKVSLTLNARAARNIIEQRASRHADPEIRKLANRIFDVLSADSPALFSDYTRTLLPDGTCEITTPNRKV